MSGSASKAPYVREPVAERERELAGATREVEQASVTGRGCLPYEIVDHHVGVGEPEPVVVPGGAPVQVGLEPHRVGHTATIA
jgi:tRNA(Ile2) C34 agmatinyltransferase TiaS